ncbi:transcription factor/transcription regulator, putative [Medicago truncatula]|uniref:Transcription factor/transcription regulator, putative n=1 Tax=Medicago truncatula TaxID=3880 RepID=G7IJQ5_MEDTR|nr:transcription factor/transcription regulator, putative [Medicago truncatula]
MIPCAMQTIFARNYLSYLDLTLTKIKENNNSSKDNNSNHIKNVKYEVDIAMVFSAQDFAWGNILKLKLQKECHDVNDVDKMKNLIRLIPGREEMCYEHVCKCMFVGRDMLIELCLNLAFFTHL